MAKIMRLTTIFSFVTTAITATLFHCYGMDIYLTFAITFGTTAYHLGMRLLVGLLYNLIMKNQADYTKNGISFIPLIASLYFGSFFVFLLTSICGAMFELLFVVMRRFNRPRIMKIAHGQK